MRAAGHSKSLFHEGIQVFLMQTLLKFEIFEKRRQNCQKSGQYLLTVYSGRYHFLTRALTDHVHVLYAPMKPSRCQADAVVMEHTYSIRIYVTEQP